MSTAGLYLSVASTRLTNANYGSDGGDLLAAILTRGIPHPTGYPLYVLLGNIFQWIPISTPVFRAVLLSLIPAALGAGLLTGWISLVIGSETIPSIIAAALGGLTWGVAPLFYSQAVIVEVHGLQGLIVVIVLWWITLNLRFKQGYPSKWLLGLSFLVGLGFGNHLTVILLIPAMLIALIYLVRNTGRWHLAIAQILLLVLGMLIYLYLPIRAHAYPAVNWGNPQTWSGFLWEVSGYAYRGFLIDGNLTVVWDRIRSISGLLLSQFGALGLVAGVVGVIQHSFRDRWLRGLLVWIFLAYLSFAIIYKTNDSAGYLIPTIMVFAIWIGLAVPALWNLHWRGIPIGAIIIGLLTLSVLIQVPYTRSRVDPRLQDQPARFAEQLLKDAPANAIVYTSSDQDSFPLWYYHFGLHERSDLHIVVLPMTQFVWYQQTLTHTYPDLKFPAIYSRDQPNADWGFQIAQLNSQLAVCNTRISSDAETGVTYQCNNP